MVFNSFAFLIFLPMVFILYWWVFNTSLRFQNAWLVFASYLFYGWWDYRFLFLILASTLLDFWVGQQLNTSRKSSSRKAWLALSVVFNLSLLGFFKYYNFFIEEGVALLSALGFQAHPKTIQVILPVGISFYTFQTMSYTIDIYRNNIQPTKNVIAFAAFVSFFPQLVAGPIERASRLLPQLLTHRQFDYEKARLGLGLIVWGLFKKVVIADSFAPLVDRIFDNAAALDAGSLFVGAVLFAFQIYGDFSGYSDMAIGTAALFGIQLMTNFNKPYFAVNIQDFWRRWHISLTTWFKDYVYIPLGGSRVGKGKVLRNVFLVFLISGLWHGANFTFLAWGFLHFLYYLPSIVRKKNAFEVLPTGLVKLAQILGTFSLVALAWVFFRASSVTEAWDYLIRLFTFQSGAGFIASNTHWVLFAKGVLGTLLLLFYEGTVWENVKRYNVFHFFILVLAVLALGSFRNPISFIYFQF